MTSHAGLVRAADPQRALSTVQPHCGGCWKRGRQVPVWNLRLSGSLSLRLDPSMADRNNRIRSIHANIGLPANDRPAAQGRARIEPFRFARMR